MYKRLGLFLIIASIIISGCAARSSGSPSSAPAVGRAPNTGAEVAKGGFSYDNGSTSGVAAPQAIPALPASQPAAPEQTDAQGQRIVIRNADLTIVVVDPSQAMSAVRRMAEEMGGFVVISNLHKTSGANGREFPEANITIRVPAAKLDDALDKIKALVRDPKNDVLSENVNGQDVTKDYTDQQSRLRNLENAEAQLREIMASATKTEDVLAVYNQLTQIREQIEVTKGQIKYYEESAAMSSIAVLIQAQASVQPLEIGGWQPVGEARNAVQGLIDTLQFLGTIAIWLVLYALPVGLVIFLPVRLVWWLISRARKNRKKAVPAPPTASGS